MCKRYSHACSDYSRFADNHLTICRYWLRCSLLLVCYMTVSSVVLLWKCRPWSRSTVQCVLCRETYMQRTIKYPQIQTETFVCCNGTRTHMARSWKTEARKRVNARTHRKAYNLLNIFTHSSVNMGWKWNYFSHEERTLHGKTKMIFYVYYMLKCWTKCRPQCTNCNATL